MTINEYRSRALRTGSHVITGPVPYVWTLDGLMGFSDEAGEAIDILKRVLF